MHNFCIYDAVEQPWSYGAYEFYEMDEEKHRYSILSYMNITSPLSTAFFPEFIVQSVMKTAMGDDDFEFRVRTTPFPTPDDVY